MLTKLTHRSRFASAWAVLWIAPTLAVFAQEGEVGASGPPARGDAGPLSLRLADDAPAEGVAVDVEAAMPRGFWIFPSRPPLSGTLSTDRPGFSDSYVLVPRGHHHLEMGYSFYYDREHSTRTTNHTLGEFSFRAGLLDEFELRVKWTGFSLTESLFTGESRYAGRRIRITDEDNGGTDMSVGFKSPLLKQDGLIPNLSIIPAISLPTGTNSKSTNDVDPEVRLAWNYSLTDKWSLYGVALATYISDGDGRFFQSGASLATYYQFTSNVGGFFEYYGLYPSTRDSDCQHNIDFGPVFLINDNMQIDIRAGFGLNEEAPDFQAGVGFSIRF